MMSLAHVLLPLSKQDPATALKEALARFEAGGRGDVPDAWLEFHDDTVDLEKLHNAKATVQDGQLHLESDEWLWRFQGQALVGQLASHGIDHWSGRIREVVPDFQSFAERYYAYTAFEPSIGRFGRWLNPLGKWDWWHLGGGFNGRITGRLHGSGRPTSSISSGPLIGRQVLGNLVAALEDALDQPPSQAFDVRADDNVELVSTLLADLRAGLPHPLSSTIVLPPGAADDSLRWIDSWPSINPADAVQWLGLAPDAPWVAVTEACYQRFSDHWAAAFAYHH